MITIENLEQLINDENIQYDYANLKKINGMCVLEGNEYYIIINENLKSNPLQLKMVLAEELGHYFTMINDATPYRNDSYNKKVQIDKEETKALRWATDYLIPTDQLMAYMRNQSRIDLANLIDYFEVTRDFFMSKLYFMSKKQDYYFIKDKSFLCLTNYPSFYITTLFDDRLVDKLKMRT